jgi:hypothetical protein
LRDILDFTTLATCPGDIYLYSFTFSGPEGKFKIYPTYQKQMIGGLHIKNPYAEDRKKERKKETFPSPSQPNKYFEISFNLIIPERSNQNQSLFKVGRARTRNIAKQNHTCHTLLNV